MGLLLKVGAWWTKEVRGCHGLGLWKAIVQGFFNHVKEIDYKIGDGRRVKFWKDSWCNDSSLMVEYPLLFNIAANKDAKVKDYFVGENGQISWNITFIRHFNDWELDRVLNFFQQLYDSKISFEGNDSLVWRKDAKGLFSVKSFYNTLIH